MKKMICEICGSNNIEKKDGFFVCNSCGTRYSTEEAKKLLVEVTGNVEVSGTVKVDNSARLANLYSNARRARNAVNFEEAAKYYDYILMEDPNSWEANFFSVYCKAFSCKIAEIGSYAILVANSFPEVLRLIKDNVPRSDWDSTVKELAILLDALYRELIKGSYDFHKKYYDFVSIANDGFNCCDGVGACGDAIDVIFKGNPAVVKNAAIPWETCVFLCDGLINLRPSTLDPYTLTYLSRNSYSDKMNIYQGKIFRVSDPAGYRRRQEEERKKAEEFKKEWAEKQKEMPQTEREKELEEQIVKNTDNTKVAIIFGPIFAFIGFVAFFTFIDLDMGPIGILFTILLMIGGMIATISGVLKKRKTQTMKAELAALIEDRISNPRKEENDNAASQSKNNNTKPSVESHINLSGEKKLWKMSNREKVTYVQERAKTASTEQECNELLDIIYPLRYETEVYKDIHKLISDLEMKRDSI